MRSGGVFWRALEAARRANLEQAGAPPPLRGTGGMSRRRLLGALAAGAVMPLAGCKPMPAAEAPSSVAIIGGGLAGLVALRDLLKAGIDARLYEARGRLGGRVFTSHGGPVPADDGGQFINSDHVDMLELAESYGLTLIDREQAKGNSLLIDDGRLVPEADVARDLQAIAARIAADSEALDSDYEANAPAFDVLSVAQYLDRHADALTRPYVRSLLEATIRTEYGQEPGEASALELIFNLPVADGRHFEILGLSDERFVLEGGSGTLVAALARELMPHVSVGHTLTALERTGDGVRLRFANGHVAEAERVIVTVPAPVLRTIDFGGLLPDLWRQYVAEIGCGRNEKLNAAYHGRPWEAALGRSGACWPLRDGFAEVWDAGTVPSETGLLTFFMGGDQCARLARQDAASLRRAFEGDAAAALPGLSEAASFWQRRTGWQRDPFARGAYSCFRPGQLTRFAGLFWIEEEEATSQAAVAGPLIFAGEHLSDAWPGYMNGAAQTGRLAARAAARAG